MLFVYSNLRQFKRIHDSFKARFNESLFIDLSKHPVAELADQAEQIVGHHSQCVVFLGHLEPGWMLDPAHQTRMRSIIRKFPVCMLTKFVDSIPHSWKNEIAIYYPVNLNGSSNSLNDGSSVQDQSNV